MGQVPDITLVVPPPLSPAAPHVGVAYIAESLAQSGVRIAVFDLNIRLYHALPPSEREPWGDRGFVVWGDEAGVERLLERFRDPLEQLLLELADSAPRCIGLTVQFTSLLTSMHLVQRLKQLLPQLPIIAGGPSFFVGQSDGRPAIMCNRFAVMGQPERRQRLERWLGALDLVVLGEGEDATLEAMQRLRQGRDLGGIHGTARFRDGQYEVNPPRAPISPLDRLPAPTFDAFDLSLYTSRRLPVTTVRGCPMRCAFCTERHIWGARARARSPEHAVAELEHHIQRYGVRQFEFTDMQVNTDLARLAHLARLMTRRCPDIRWNGNAVVNRRMDARLIRECAASGATTWHFGVESGSSRVLKRMGKRFQLEDAVQNLRDCREAGILASVNIIVGFPGETEDDFLQTCRFLEHNRDHIAAVSLLSICTVHRDSDLGRAPERFGLDPHFLSEMHDVFELVDWVDANGLDFAARYERLDRLRYLLDDLAIPHPMADPPLPPAPLPEHERRWLRALGQERSGPITSLDRLVQTAMDDADPLVRAGATRLLGTTRGRRFKRHLGAALQDQHPDVRQAAMDAMAQITLPEQVTQLTPVLLDHMVRKARRLGSERMYELYEKRARNNYVVDAGGQPMVQLCAVALVPGGDDTLPRPGGALWLQVTYRVNRTPGPELVLRVQLFARDKTELERRLLFGTNSARTPSALPAAPGEHRVTLVLDRLNLSPGHYNATVGLWPGELSQHPYVVHHGAYKFQVEGNPAAGPLHQPLILHQPRVAEEAPDVTEMHLEPGADDACWRLTAGHTLRVCLALAAAADGPATLTLSLLRDDLTLCALQRSVTLEQGAEALQLELSPLNLLAGRYTLRACLASVADGGDRPVEYQAQLVVGARRDQGAGLVYCPHRWVAAGAGRRLGMLTDVRLLDPQQQEATVLPEGSTATLVVRTALRAPNTAPPLRLRLLATSSTVWGDEALFSAAAEPAAEPAAPKTPPCELTLRGELDLGPLASGDYLLQLGLAPRDEAYPWQVAHRFTVTGQQPADPAQPVLLLAPTLVLDPEPEPAETTPVDLRSCNAVGRLCLAPTEGNRDVGELQTGAPLVLEAALNAPAEAALVVNLRRGPRLVARHRAGQPIPAGRHRLRWILARLDLLAGEYGAVMELRVPHSERLIGRAELPLTVHSQPTDGDGLIRLPLRWRVER